MVLRTCDKEDDGQIGSGRRIYIYLRRDVSSVGDILNIADGEFMRKIYGIPSMEFHCHLGLSEPILKIGRNEYFNPETPHSLPEEYVSELLDNFSGFLEEQYQPMNYVVVGETGDKMEILPHGHLNTSLEIPLKDVEELVNRFTGLLQEYKGEGN